MTETRFTPGPWRLGPHTATQVSSEAGSPVCNTGGWSDSRMDQEEQLKLQISNAHLIAAAPELYEALADLMDEYDLVDVEGGEPEAMTEAYMTALDVLAQARGEQS